MNKIEKIARKGWTITEIRFDKYQNFWYCGAAHDSGEAVADGRSGESMSAALDELCRNANDAAPAWYMAQLAAA